MSQSPTARRQGTQPQGTRPRGLPARITAVTVVGMAGGIALVLLAGWTVMKAQRVLGWALVAALLAALVWPLRNLLDRHVPKVLATILSILALIVLPVTLMVLAFRDLSQQFDHLREALLQASGNVEESGRFSDLAQRFHLTEQVQRLLDTTDPTGGGVSQATSLASALVVVIVLTIFLVADNGRIVRNMLRQVPDGTHRLRIAGVLGFAYRRWSRYQLAVLAKAVVIGTLVYASARAAGLPAATVAALVVGVASLVPSVGVVVGGIPVVLLAAGFRNPWPSGVVAFVLIVALQIADHELMTRVIQPRTTTFGPVVPVVLALVVGQQFGLGSALCSIAVVTFFMAILEAIGVGARRDASATPGPAPARDRSVGSDPMGWNFADTWEHNADRFGDLPALSQADRTFTWHEVDRRADGIAAALQGAGLPQGAKVAQYMYTCPEYIESMFGLFKAGFAPVNTNYRYTDDELAYLWDNADVEAVVFHATFTPRCAALRDRLPGIKVWLWVGDGSEPCPAWATPYETAAATATERFRAPWGRSGDDLFMLYTGGTTGMPKGVMWRQDDLLISLDSGSRRPLPATPGWDEFDARFPKPGPRHLPGAPMMHGTGAFGAMWGLVIGGSVVMTPGRSFDAVEMLDTISTRRINGMTMVGDAFGKPLLAALDAEPDRWDISSLRFIMSSGAMCSSATKHGLLRHNPRLMIVDSLGSSEAISMASDTFDASVAAGGGATTARFRLGPDTKVITDDGHEVLPGSGESGRVARRGRTPLGYYKDPEKSAATFVSIGGERWTIPGDYAEVEADGALRLLGRGSQCINTGGEKVYPEEVEEALKLHPAVRDVAVVGVPDDRFGETITAIVELGAGEALDEAALIAHVKGAIASYKAPRHVIAVATIGRAPNGKLDYRRLKAEAIATLG